jgi:hypothetical protein
LGLFLKNWAIFFLIVWSLWNGQKHSTLINK